MKAITLICLITAGLHADSVLWNRSRDGAREVALVLSDGAFTQERLEQLARVELARTPRANFIRLTMVGAKGRLPLPKATTYSFAAWLRLYEPPGPNEIAEMIANGDDAVLRVRDLTGKLTERVLSGRNPLTIAVGEEDFQIVHVSAGVAILYGGDVRVFLRTARPLRVETGEALLEALQASFPNFGISVSAQNIPWFVNEGDYPISNPFAENGRPPTPEEYLRTKTLRCSYVSGLPACRIE